jgi:hypothetical protein
MGKLLILVLGLAAVGYLGYRTMYGPMASRADGGQGTPREQLEGVKGAARHIEAIQQQAADDALQKATSE